VTWTRLGRINAAHERAVGCWYRYLYKPYYVRSPRRLLHRLAGDLTVSQVRLPWQLPIMFQPGSIIGTQLVRTGVHDLILSECLFRITDAKDVCVDVGANIGYTTSLLATRSGPGGRVLSFEPAPDVFGLLKRNIASWREAGVATIDAYQTALSSAETAVMLATPAGHRGDAGGRTLESIDAAIDAIRVQSSTLDRAAPDRIDVLKIDVEGHEFAVLEGCEHLLRRHAIRDVVFEEHHPPPTQVTNRLAAAGYTVFRLEQGFRGPRLEADIEHEFAIYWNAPNYLATIDPVRAAHRFRSPGWRCLRLPRK